MEAKGKTLEALKVLREKMEREGISACIFPTDDYHGSEYVAPFFQARAHFSGFTGSAGTLVVMKDKAFLWTDGRYFIQAAREMEGCGIELMKMGEEKTPEIEDVLLANLKAGEKVSVDGRCIALARGKRWEKKLSAAGITLEAGADPAEGAWPDRPKMPASPAFVLDEKKYAGRTVEEKLVLVREEIRRRGADTYVSAKLDEIMWLFNIRANDVEYNPVALSYMIIQPESCALFIQEEALTDAVRSHLLSYGVTIRPYGAFLQALEEEALPGTVLIDAANLGYAFYRALLKNQGQEILEGTSPVSLLKAVRNPVELANFRDCYIEDSAVLTKFIYWLKKNVGKERITEGSAAAKLDAMRAEVKDFVELSFTTISAYGPNAALMHYHADGDGAEVKQGGMLLVDSGGHYLRGTTDVTRTMSLGPVTEEERRAYSLTANSVFALQDCQFLKGSSGITLDILARAPMWSLGMDYKCGTGHGIGYLLNVHEGPQSIRYRKRSTEDDTPFVPGMVVSDEPGVYRENEFGIRIETILVCVERCETADGSFLGFEPLTFVPLDRELLDREVLTPAARESLNRYHRQVLEKISPFLNDEERQWLEEQCREI